MIPELCEECGGGVMAEASPRIPQIPEKEKMPRKAKEEKRKFVKKACGFRGARKP